MTVPQVASLLQVNPSTVWRWINQGLVPAYRIGQRRVRLKRADLANIISPARERLPEDGAMASAERERLSRQLTKEEQAEALKALDAARELRGEILARRGGKLFSPSWAELNEARDERSGQLG